MATYTMYLKDVNEITHGKIGLDRYPIFDEDYREGLNQKILDRYFNREIGMETIDLFQLAVHRKMNEQMPRFNQLYESAKLTFDPLSTVNLKTMSNSTATGKVDSEAVSATNTSGESESTHNSTSGNNATNTARGRSVTSETPQSMLADDGDYATGAADSNSENTSVGSANETGTNTSNDNGTSNGTSTGKTENEGTQEAESTTTGYQGLTSDMIMRFRETFMNIDLDIVNMLDECFMNPWDNGDSYNARDTLKFFPNLY